MSSQKPDTPMKRLKNHFKRFHRLTGRLTGKPVELYRAQGRYIPWPFQPRQDRHQPHNGIGDDRKACMKGVKSDFVRFYHTSADSSFGFVFTFLETDSPTVQFTIKAGDTVTSFDAVSVDVFKDQMNGLLKVLEAKRGLTMKGLLDALHATFVTDKAMDFDQVVKEAQEEVKQLAKPVQTELLRENRQQQQLQDSIHAAEASWTKQVEALPETKRIRELKKELAALEKQQEAKRAAIKKDLCINQLKRDFDKRREAIAKLVAKRDAVLTKVQKKYPAFAAPRISAEVRDKTWWKNGLPGE